MREPNYFDAVAKFLQVLVRAKGEIQKINKIKSWGLPEETGQVQNSIMQEYHFCWRNKRWVNQLFFVFLFVFTAAGVRAFGDDRTMRALNEQEPSLSQSPQKIVSLVPAFTQSLILLGAEDRLVGVTTYCSGVSDTIAKVASAVEVNVEEVIRLEPDIVFGSPLINKQNIASLEKAGIKVVSLSPPKDFNELCRQFAEIGALVGESEKAHLIIEQARQQVEEVQKSVQGLPRPKVFFQIGARPLFTVNKDYFLHEYIVYAGGENIARDYPTGMLSREQVIARNPDYIFIVTMGVVGEQEQQIWERFPQISAVAQGRIFVIDSDKTCSPTPVRFVEVLKEITRKIHPGVTFQSQ